MNEDDLVKIFIGITRYSTYLQNLKKKQKVLEAQNDAGLTDLEMVVIHSYTDVFFDEINKYLREGKFRSPYTQEQLDNYSNVLSRAIKKLPIKDGEVRLRRDIWLSPEMIESLRNNIDKKIKFSAFTSTTQHKHSVMESRKLNCRMEIKSASGRDISVFSFYSRVEQEVLFDMDTIFVVKSVDIDPFKNTVTVVILDENVEE
ncbi:ADP-ribosyltransferase [Acinetobacter guillouiae]|uniref:ADP-ribosyltransferase n=1 Tax=Acinetobacter guillouiae TaxID=106649 RepID=UPI001CD7834D|nr:ADP-ribosyltransferase [Acinetobacter guillouiae]